jgi:hypothetical protein
VYENNTVYFKSLAKKLHHATEYINIFTALFPVRINTTTLIVDRKARYNERSRKELLS